MEATDWLSPQGQNIVDNSSIFTMHRRNQGFYLPSTQTNTLKINSVAAKKCKPGFFSLSKITCMEPQKHDIKVLPEVECRSA
jgi:hypothetical protein